MPFFNPLILYSSNPAIREMNKTINKQNRRVVITGLGVVSSIGIGWPEFWKNLIAGKSGISKIESFDTSAYDRHYGGEIKNFEPQKFIDRRKLKFLGRASQLAIAASRLALDDAKLNPKDLPKDRTGACIGTTMGEPQILEIMNRTRFTEGLDNIDPGLVPTYPSSVIPNNIAEEFKLGNKVYLFANACASGNYSIGYSYDLIRTQKADIMLAGGADQFSRLNFTGFTRLMSIAPEKCQPFDKNRQGLIAGEGSGILIIESLDSALARKADIYAEILGYGLSCDAHHMTMPSQDGIYMGIKQACDQARIDLDKVDYISAHGTGTPQNDQAECKAIRHLFKEKVPPVSSIKSMLGHTMGAASAIEAVSCCLAIKDGLIPPTINFETPDPECDIDCVPNKAREAELNLVLNNASAFGGNNCCVVVRKVG